MHGNDPTPLKLGPVYMVVEDPQIGEVKCGESPHLTCKRRSPSPGKRDEIKMKDYMDRRVTPPKRVTSSTRGPPPPCKHALNLYICVTSDEVFENPKNVK